MFFTRVDHPVNSATLFSCSSTLTFIVPLFFQSFGCIVFFSLSPFPDSDSVKPFCLGTTQYFCLSLSCFSIPHDSTSSLFLYFSLLQTSISILLLMLLPNLLSFNTFPLMPERNGVNTMLKLSQEQAVVVEYGYECESVSECMYGVSCVTRLRLPFFSPSLPSLLNSSLNSTLFLFYSSCDYVYDVCVVFLLCSSPFLSTLTNDTTKHLTSLVKVLLNPPPSSISDVRVTVYTQ